MALRGASEETGGSDWVDCYYGGGAEVAKSLAGGAGGTLTTLSPQDPGRTGVLDVGVGDGTTRDFREGCGIKTVVMSNDISYHRLLGDKFAERPDPWLWFMLRSPNSTVVMSALCMVSLPSPIQPRRGSWVRGPLGDVRPQVDTNYENGHSKNPRDKRLASRHVPVMSLAQLPPF